MSLITNIAEQAAIGAKVLATKSSELKKALLSDMANALRIRQDEILNANSEDLANARDNGLSDAMIDRLTLTAQRIEDMAVGLETVAHLPDVVGTTRLIETRPNGIDIQKMRVPLGVICMIYEARPNVTADAAGLCIKSGNAVILRGGKEALSSSLAIADALQSVLKKYDLPTSIVSVIPDPNRALLNELLTLKQYIDLVIPRGGEGLINFVSENSKIPVIQHYKGVCHLYVDKDADLEKALNILVNGKTQRPGVCNALEGLVVHKDIAERFLPMVNEIFEKEQVTVNGESDISQYFSSFKPIENTGFGEEYLSLEISVKVVDSLEKAIKHIDDFGSNHTEVICTENNETAAIFQQVVDASVVMVNASSRFSDGSELGLGAEIGIATTKLHAYGPMGIESLTTEKFLVNGTGQVRV
ncbi:glutamate-5-semialdehyde dehydrogenase [Thalassotalea sp. PP2-459]|uniref:glutamate-5-semialdehyde dehydrogenase n=1 Tax=Thalassotalea sp. PP2-459 TaxID=1742724 RepID=UPI0009434F8C|nr:glutamate-5-semialdehyde dehydrogenase [Thalassotalea sp. PP2-459]OKY27477.1 glutamate-5-semialdehyde dehydrogenase [Thalassotalea sp. PP2-459]